MAKRIGIKNLKAFQNKLKKRMVTNPEKHLKGLVQRSTTLVEGTAKSSIVSGSPSGRTYTRGSISHTASAAGQPPASDIGQIVASAPYAKPLEFGTTQMSARPFMQPALNKNRAKINRIFKAGGYLK